MWLLATSIAPEFICRAQTQHGTQLWLDFVIDHPFANQYLFEVETSYQTLLADDSTWRNFSLTPTLEYQFFPNVDLVLSNGLSYTKQTADHDSFESRLTGEFRYHISQNKRVNTRAAFKADKRFFRDIGEGEWEHSSRIRLKAEATIAINHPTLYFDRLWYGITDIEKYFVVDEEVDERYSNRTRIRLGIGYRVDYLNRFELIYTLQSARNQIEEEFKSIDNVIQLRYKMFFNPSDTPAKQSSINSKQGKP